MFDSAPYPWQHAAWVQLLTQFQADRLAHAYLLQGEPGTGRGDFAWQMARRLLCERGATLDTQQACGTCRQCQLFASGSHPDVLMMSPAEDSKVIKIEQVRAVNEQLQQTANQQGVYKIVVINPADALNNQAANALLKSLEEPPGRTVFFVIVPHRDSVLPTLQSRCQPLPLERPTHEQALGWLRAHNSAADALLESALALAPGRPVYALELLESGVPQWRELLLEKLSELAVRPESLSDVAKFCEQQEPVHATQLLAQRCCEHLDGLIVQQKQGANHAEVQHWLQRYKAVMALSKLLASSSNANLQLGFEALLADWHPNVNTV